MIKCIIFSLQFKRGKQMRKHRVLRGVLCACLLIFVVLGTNTNCRAEDEKIENHPHVLFLSSYSYEWESIPLQLSGIKETLDGKAITDYVFMNTKRYRYEDVKNSIYNEVEDRGQRHPFDYVIAGDDAALKFVLEYREQLFSGIPIVFEGISDEAFAEDAAKDSSITGIVESFPLEQTIQLAASINPKATRVVGITDDSASGRGSTKQFYDCADSFANLSFETLDASTLTAEELGNEVSSYGDETILIFLMMTNDSDKNLYSNTEAVEFISSVANIPLYKADELGIGDGVLGGVMVSYYDMASSAAQIVLDLDAGASVSDYEIMTASGRCTFDKNEMDRFSIRKKDITKAYDGEVEYINDPPGFLETHRNVLIPASLIILLLLIIIVSGYFSSKRERLLNEAKREAVKAKAESTAKSELLSRMSHDMRTPLNAVLGFTQLAQEEKNLPENVMDYLRKINDSGSYLSGLISDILDMAKIENGKIELHEEKVNRLNALNEIAELFSAQASKKGIRLVTDFTELKAKAGYEDKLRTNQIYANLLSNAIKYSDEGTEITWVVKDAVKGEGWVHCTTVITDQGKGMTEEFMKKMFDPFEQGDTSYSATGTGLGLAIVKNLVTIMKGTITVKSSIGKGTVFTVEFDRKICDEESVDESDEKLPDVKRLEGKRILICEDNELNATIASKILENFGMKTEIAENGKIGVEMVINNEPYHFNAVIMDIRMPVMDGLEAAKEIRKLPRMDATEIPIIAMSANAFEEDIQKSIIAGMNAHLSKPIDTEKMITTLNELIK